MAKYSNTVEYKLRTSLDDAGLVKLQNSISKTQAELQRLSNLSIDPINTSQLEKSIQTLDRLKEALSKSFNVDIGFFDAKKFTSELNSAKLSINEITKAFNKAGTQGKAAFTDLVTRVSTLDSNLKTVSNTTQKLFTTFSNTVRWGVTASVFETMSNSLGRAVDYVKELDRSLNDIRIVSGYSESDMREFANQANSAAKALGQTTTAYTDASLIYIQQGKTLEESKQLAELTMKVANVTGQETAEVSEQITSIMNGYQTAVSDMEASMDRFAKVAAVGASDMEELATAASRVASTANALGVNQDQLVAQLSTIISVTRQAPRLFGYISL